MDIGNEIQNYGLFCLNHSRLYGGKTIDKITFTVPRHYFRKNIFHHKNKMCNGVFYVENCHNQYFKLHIQGEHINPLLPMINSVIAVFNHISLNQIFLEEINQKIRKNIEKCKCFNNESVEFIKFLNNYGFRFAELELAFDFFDCFPFVEKNNHVFRRFKNSYYTNDYKTIYRKEFREDDSYGKVKDRIRDSMLAIYDRGCKLGVNETVWRVEWRLRDIRSWMLLDITDLRLNMDGYICSKGYRLKKIFNYWVSQDSIIFNREYIEWHFPIFSFLTTG